MILPNDKKVIVLLLVPVSVYRLDITSGSPSDGEHSFLDLRPPHYSNIARNGNRDSKQSYFISRLLPVTGLNGALLIPFFWITDIWDRNPKSPILRGGKPTLIFPFGWRIAVHLGFGRETKKGLFLGCRFLGAWFANNSHTSFECKQKMANS